MIEQIYLYLIGGFILGLILRTTNKQNEMDKYLSKIEILINNNTDVIDLSSTISNLAIDIDNKKEILLELEAELENSQLAINRNMDRIEYLKNSGELKKLESLNQTVQNLNSIKSNLVSIQKKKEYRFNVAVLVSIVQELFEELYNEELDLLGVQDLMRAYSDIDIEEDVSSSGSSDKKINKKKPLKAAFSGLRR
jgi:hypothetical protein